MPPRSKQQTSGSTSVPQPEHVPERRSRPRAVRSAPKVTVDVTAVLVAHDGAAWLPEAIAALKASSRVPTKIVCVDTGSTDGSPELLEAAFGEVLRLPRTTGYGAAVAQALTGGEREAPTAEPATWVWLLHDDVAVEPTTLEALLDHAETSPSAAMLGPKVRDWHDPRYLVEVGLTTDAAGHRETGLEHREYDQGQHDGVRDVLAVGTAAALVRRTAFDQVGGLDRNLPVFRDDVDLGWKLNAAGHRVVVVPQARIRHVRASITGHRETDAAAGRVAGIDRRHALYVLLAHASWWRLLGLLPRLVVATAVRALALLLTRQVVAAGDEWRALFGTLGRPGLLHRARRQRGALRQVSQRQLRPLFASRTVRIRARLAAFADWLSGGAPASTALGALGDPGPEGPDVLAEVNDGPGVLRAILIRPGVLLFLALTAVALLAERSVLAVHGGVLHGGALLAPDLGASDLWATYLASWHDVSVGTRAATPPMTGLLALLSSLFFGKAWLVVDTLLLASVPLAGASAYFAASRLVANTPLRLWAGATWALLPVATGAVAAGRLDAAVVQIALPMLALAAARVFTGNEAGGGLWRYWALGLALAGVAAFAPLMWPIVGGVLVIVGVVELLRHRRSGVLLASVIVSVVPALVLFPWSLSLFSEPSLLLSGQSSAQDAVSGLPLLFLSPGGPGVPVAWLSAGVVLAGLGGLVRESFRRLALVSWALALVGYAAALLLARLEVNGSRLWPGLPLQLSALAILVAALVAGNGVRARLAGRSFGWRQLLVTFTAGLAVVAPLLLGASWIGRGAEGPLTREQTTRLPAFARAELQANPGVRVLSLKPHADGALGYELHDRSGARLDEAGLMAPAGQRRELDRLVADLASQRGSDAAEALATRAVRFVILGGHGPHQQEVARALDAQVGLVRRTSGEVDLWRVAPPTHRLSVLEPKVAERALAGDRSPAPDLLRSTPPLPLPAGAESASATLPVGLAGRLLVLADAAEGGWQATLNGRELQAQTAWGWAQAFELPADGGKLEVSHASRGRRTGVILQAIALVGVCVLAAPGGRRRRGLEDDVDVDADNEPTRARTLVTAL